MSENKELKEVSKREQMGRKNSSSDWQGGTFERNILKTPECSDKNQ